MFVKTLTETLGTPDHVTGDSFESRRILLARDQLGYSFHDTLIKAGSTQHLEYKNHIEANYCIEGQGEVEEVATGRIWPLVPGTMYVLDRHDAHIIRAHSDLRLLCVFTPALRGDETHDAEGGYGVG